MRDLAPEITRQRLLIEGYYSVAVTEQVVRDYLLSICKKLGLRAYGEPIIHSPSGEGSAENQGFDAFIPLIDSGISLYVWSNRQFFSVVIYTCKVFNNDAACKFTKQFFSSDEVEHAAF